MKSSPIYNVIDNPKRRSDCSFGAGDRFTQTVRVGTSASNSHVLGTITVERHEITDGTVVFTMWLDGQVVRRGTLDGKDFTMDVE